MKQDSLFANDTAPAWERLPLPGADVRVLADFIADHQRYYELLSEELAWRQDRVHLFGREHWVPRLSAWYGEPEAVYSYSGLELDPLPWSPTLAELRARVEAATGARFNSVLANWYRDGADGMGKHADDERELGPRPVIASLSLGGTRRFSLQHKRDKSLPTHTVALSGGMLLVMAGDTQRHYQHWVAKTKKPVAGRINLTFRCVNGKQ